MHRFAWLTAGVTLGLIGLGGLVTSHGVGMAVPDWPTTYGYNMFFFPISQWVGGIFYEHTHRLLASGVGLLTTILALWLWGTKARKLLRWGGVVFLVGAASRPWWLPHDTHQTGASLGIVGAVALAASFVWPCREPSARHLRWMGVAAFFGVVLQGVLGGLRVVLFRDGIGVFHAALAQLFLVLVTLIAVFTGRWWSGLVREQISRGPGPAAGLRLGLPVLTSLIFCQLIIAAAMRHQHAGLAIPDFPLAYHQIWPALDPASVATYNANRIETVAVNPITAGQIVLQLVHRLVAVLIFTGIAWVAGSTWRKLTWQHPLTRGAAVWLGLVLVQVGLGAWTIWSNKAADIATAHVVVGALCLVTGALLTAISFRVLIPGRVSLPANVMQINRGAPAGAPQVNMTHQSNS